MENKMAKLLKEEMINMIHVMNFENEEVQQELFQKYMHVFQLLTEIHEYKKKHDLQGILTPKEECCCENEQIEKEIEEQPPKEQETTPSPDEKPMYRLERKIRGGYIPEISAFIPEGIIRKLGLEHGDYVYATPIEQDDAPESRFFHYELAKKGDGMDHPDRVQINYCVVKKEAGRFVVDKSEETGEYIRVDGNYYTAILDDYDVQEHAIQEGDVIDIAFPVQNPNLVKILWKHHFEETNKPTESGKNLSDNKKKEEKKEKEEEVFEQTLKGKSVLVIGNEPKKNLYRFSIEQRGGTFLWADAKDDLIRLEALVKKADLVIFLLKVSGHVGMEHIKKMCKEYSVPFETTWSVGKTNIIRMAENTEIATIS